MKSNKYVEELNKKNATELNQELVAAKKELFNLRFQNATNQLDNTARIKDVRRATFDFTVLCNFKEFTITPWRYCCTNREQ